MDNLLLDKFNGKILFLGWCQNWFSCQSFKVQASKIISKKWSILVGPVDKSEVGFFLGCPWSDGKSLVAQHLYNSLLSFPFWRRIMPHRQTHFNGKLFVYKFASMFEYILLAMCVFICVFLPRTILCIIIYFSFTHMELIILQITIHLTRWHHKS